MNTCTKKLFLHMINSTRIYLCLVVLCLGLTRCHLILLLQYSCLRIYIQLLIHFFPFEESVLNCKYLILKLTHGLQEFYFLLILSYCLKTYHHTYKLQVFSLSLYRFMLYQGIREFPIHQFGEKFTPRIRFQQTRCGYPQQQA